MGGIYFRSVLLLILALIPLGAAAEEKPRKEILILHSYHHGMEWTDKITMGILSTFANSPYSGIMFHIEYLDTKNFFNEAYLSQIFQIYKAKYKDKKFDVIISSDDDAFNFLLKYHEELFPKSPIVFCGVNYLDPAMLRNKPLFTGIEEKFDLKGNIELMMKLHPLAQRIIVINDQTATGKGNEKRLEQIIPLFSDKLQFVIYDNETKASLQVKLKKLFPTDLVLLLTFNRDKNGENISYPESASMISKNSPVPVYGVWDFYIGHGVVGGLMTSGFQQGKLATELAIRILNGESVTNLPIIQENANQYMFDYEEVMRYLISVSEIPEDSVVVNRPLSLYEQNKLLVWVIAAGVGGLIIALVILYFVQLRTRNAYLHSEERYKKLAQASFEGIVLHENLKIVDVNDSYAKMTGYKPHDMIGMSVLQIIAPEDRVRVEKLIIEGYDKPFESKLQRRDGSSFWAEANGRNMKYQGRVIRVATVRDITEQKKAQEAMKRWFDFEKTVSSVLACFIDITDIDAAINASLTDLGSFTGADRVYVFLIGSGGDTFDNTHEWCADGVQKEIDNLKNLPIDMFSWWRDKTLKGEVIVIENVALLPNEAQAEKDILTKQGVKSLVAVPLRRGKNIVGFVGLDNNKNEGVFNDDYVAILRLFAEVLGKAMLKLS
ncbi:MAG: hypothetical protein A2Y33_03245 [Spirochaetes bacterium GWF1_51_8]|nr:MAG: hypothetical protein A2Y33_03245 [Spirochaetes bacterium GWF1_51_8]